MAKEGKSDAPMLKIKKMMEEEKKVRVDTIFVPVPEEIVDLHISNNSSSNKLLRAVFLSDSSQNTARNNLFEE